MTPPDDLLTYEGAAARLRVSTRTLQGWVGAGTVPHLRIGRYVRFDAAQLDKWAEAQVIAVSTKP